MTRQTSSLALACVVVVVATGVAQERPNFSGTWLIDTRASVTSDLFEETKKFNAIEKGIRLFPPGSCILSQSTTTLTVEEHYVAGRGSVQTYPPNSVISYPLDGRAVTNKVVIDDPQNTRLIRPSTVFTSLWKGNQLVTTFTLAVPGEEAPRQYERSIWLTPEDKLVIQTRVVGQPHAQTVILQRKGTR